MPNSLKLPNDLKSSHDLIRVLNEQQVQDREKNKRLAETIDQQQQTIDQQQQTTERLTTDLKLLQRAMFGRRRERFIDDPNQTYLFEVAELDGDKSDLPSDEIDTPEAEADLSGRRTSNGRQRRVFPEYLERKEIRHPLTEDEIPDDLRNDPNAKRFFKKTSEQIEIEPPKIFVLEHFQEVIVASDDENGESTMKTARKPAQLIDAYSGPSVWAFLAASRFADHLPYYRLEDILSRSGFRINRSTQWRWMLGLGVGIEPLVHRMRQLVLQSQVVGIDETPIKMLTESQSRTSYLWATVGDATQPYNCFHFTKTRSRAGPDAFLSGFEGYLQSDAYIAYELLDRESELTHMVSCYAHARRKFEELNVASPTIRTNTAMGYFSRLYDIEHRGLDLSNDDRHALRQRESRPLLEEFHAWLKEHEKSELPKSKLRAAIGYMTNRWDSFTRYLEHGWIPIDNNRTESALRGPVVGKKNWLFFGSPEGGTTAASLMTLTMSCKRLHIDVFAYLRDVFTRLPEASAEEIDSLLPDHWIKDHPQHRIQERVDEARQRADRTRKNREQRRARQRKLDAKKSKRRRPS